MTPSERRRQDEIWTELWDYNQIKNACQLHNVEATSWTCNFVQELDENCECGCHSIADRDQESWDRE